MKMFFILMAGIFLNTSCAVTKDYVATGGSRADGMIQLSYEVSNFEQPHTSEQQGLDLARKKCSVWGYKDAEALGGTTKTCNQSGITQCHLWIITKQYQCLGNLEKS